MREILFRGKVVNDDLTQPGEWVQGDLLQNEDGRCYIWIRNTFLDFNVDPETVGQYTGLKDKNGQMIFEGDIVDYNGTRHQVVFEDRYECAYFGIRMSEIETWHFGRSVPSNYLRIIGNIHDNPELMEGKL